MRYVTQLLTGPMTNLPAVQTPRIPVTTRYHGVDVTEDYQWLEDASSPETVAWTQAQQELTREYFESLPWRDCAAGARRAAAQGRTHVVHEPGLGREHLLRVEGSDTAAAALPGGLHRPGRHPDRAHRRRSGSNRPVGRDHDRLVRPVPGRRPSRGLAVGARDRGRDVAHLRRREWQGRRRTHPPRPPHGRLDGLARGRVRVLVHPHRRSRRVPAAGVVPRPRRSSRPAGLSGRRGRRAHRGERLVHVPRRPLADGQGAER